MDATTGSLAHRRTALGAAAAMLTAGMPSACAEPPRAMQAPGHVVLLGDSVLDNAGYLRGAGPDLLAQLRTRLTQGWQATRLAR
ncbi:MAG: hypothetical protein ACJ8H8_32670, partial [Geminicoccaceae bacterium]